MKLYWSGPLEGHIWNFSSGVWGCQVYHNIANLKPTVDYLLALIIKGGILGTFGALHV